MALSLAPRLTWAQFDFEPDSADASTLELTPPNYDSIKFEMRLWCFGWVFSSVTQLSLDHNGRWDFHRSFLIDSLIDIPKLSPKPNIRQLWSKLDSIGILTLKSQKEVTAKFIKNGKTYQLTEDQLEKMIGTEASVYVVELLSSNGFRTYSYIEPAKLAEIRFFDTEEHTWVWPEHYRMTQIIETIEEAFQNDGLSKYAIEHWRKTKDIGN
ncbi:MAG: hypothetical protein RIB71_19275 [Imperialibacter sp.]|uniref:hypothetical protein n=1 Tax=Imperialibacter sp. TaxID=2038411 RepID=UPI0032EBD61E